MNGLILVDKPLGATSHDVVACIRRILGQQAVGHFGTLDPLATGLLLVAVGSATRLFPFCSRHDKVYHGEMRLGYSTDTYDAQGKPASEESGAFPDLDTLDQAMKQLSGPREQVPPPFSAKKVGGRPLYKWARAKKAVRPKPNSIVIQAFQLKGYAPPFVQFDVHCTAGTYVRSLVHELGQAVGCGAYLTALRRLAVGPYRIDEGHSLDGIAALARAGDYKGFFIPLESLFPEAPKAVLSEPGRRRLRKGIPLPAELLVGIIPPEPLSAGPASEVSAIHRLFSQEGRFLALARPLEDKTAFLPFIVL
jgi:tRNA pseudouridine55 synthase